MPETIFHVDPTTKKTIAVSAVAFADIGIKERKDLQQWIIEHPEILGERLLVITSEFASFDKSLRRIDILALDTESILVVVELKLDASGTHADLQALRYAAFCSTMSIGDVVTAYAAFHSCTPEAASAQIVEFLDADGLPRLDKQPRIILAAGSLDDQELTGAVLWLRRFGVDISCVELTPYRVPNSSSLLLVPRTIIPIPEARDFMVKVEQKAAATIQDDKEDSALHEIWRSVAKQFNAMNVAVEGQTFAIDKISSRQYLQLKVGLPGVAHKVAHYEWWWRRNSAAFDVAIHFEADAEADNERVSLAMEAIRPKLAQGVPEKLLIGRFGDRNPNSRWREVRYRIPCGNPPSAETLTRAAELMKILVERSFPALKHALLKQP